MQELDLRDVLRVRVLSTPSRESEASRGAARRDAAEVLTTALGTVVTLDCAVPGLNPRDNLVFRALDAAEQGCGNPAVLPRDKLVIEVEKKIPAGGGLGGGSSDAAAMLKAYAQLTGIDPLDSRLVEVARSLGADVAFFLYGGCAFLSGRGDVFERALPSLDEPIVLMGDAEGMSTAVVYRAFDEDPQPLPDADALVSALEAASASSRMGEASRESLQRAAAVLCANNLDPIACNLNERLMHRLEVARAHPDTLNALVSGSGSTSFAICPDLESAKRFADDIAPLCDWVHISGDKG